MVAVAVEVAVDSLSVVAVAVAVDSLSVVAVAVAVEVEVDSLSVVAVAVEVEVAVDSLSVVAVEVEVDSLSAVAVAVDSLSVVAVEVELDSLFEVGVDQLPATSYQRPATSDLEEVIPLARSLPFPSVAARGHRSTFRYRRQLPRSIRCSAHRRCDHVP